MTKKKARSLAELTPEEQAKIEAENTIIFKRYCPILGKIVAVEGGLKEREQKVEEEIKKRGL